MSEEKSDKKSNAPSAAGKVEISRRRLLGSSSVIAASAVTSAAPPRTAASQTPSVLPPPQPPFQGKIGRTVKDSTPDFPKSIEAPGGSTQCLADPDGRRGFWSDQHLRRPDPNSQLPAAR